MLYIIPITHFDAAIPYEIYMSCVALHLQKQLYTIGMYGQSPVFRTHTNTLKLKHQIRSIFLYFLMKLFKMTIYT